MISRVMIAVFEWLPSLMIGMISLLWHLIALWTGQLTTPAVWATDALLVAITTSGLTTLTVFTRLAKGTIQVQHLSPHSFVVMGLVTVSFVLSAMMFGQVASGQVSHMPLTPPLASLGFASVSSLYFEILLAVAQHRTENSTN